MSERRRQHKIKNKKNLSSTLLDIESDDYLGFIAGYTSNGVPFGLTHKQMTEIEKDSGKDNNLDDDRFDNQFNGKK